MKTAKEIVNENYDKQNFDYADEFAPSAYVVSLETCLELMEAYADQFKHKWIKVEDELPINEQFVLTGNGNVCGVEVCQYWSNEFLNAYTDNKISGVKHWKTLDLEYKP